MVLVMINRVSSNMKIDGYTPSLPQQMTAMHAVAAPVGSKSVELFTLTNSVMVWVD